MTTNEINRQNDILVSALLNPTADVRDLIANGINAKNTGLLTPEEYKKSIFILRAFTDANGNFNTEAFDNVYNKASKKYNDLSSLKIYQDLSEYSKYSGGDIFAPLLSNKIDTSYTLQKVRNPFKQTEGVTSLFGKSEQTLSNRELAQQHRVWDTENQKWLDYTAEDQGFLGIKYLGRQGLVYATWDEDGTHFDKSLGRTVLHKKGEWKTDDNGLFYTETAGNRELYGKEFVAYSDILTKEGSWANKVDFFDSDDKHKSKFGTVMKTAATILPYMFPVAREVWGGVTATVGLATVMPTFGKMMEGIVTGDKETKFTKSMSVLENYWKKFNSSYSDESQGSMFNFEQMADMVSDIFGQLYQMRAMASLSNLYNYRYTKAEQEGFKKFSENFGREWSKLKATHPEKYTDEGFINLWKELAEHTPEMKDIIKAQSRLSKSLSLGYMAMTSSADVYEDAIQNGYDRRMAGAAGLVATAGQYAIMMNNRMGDWFLDATTGYKENVSRNIMKKTLLPYYKEIADSVDKIALAATKEEKLSLFAKLYNSVYKNGVKNFWSLLRDSGEEYWKRSLIEGVEEVTEEAVMDTTKGIFDFLSLCGVGKNSDLASFNTIDNTFSSEGVQRYLMNFVGGVLGGALFEFLGKVILPHMDAIISGKAVPEALYSIVKEVMNGHTKELLEEIDRLAKADDVAINVPIDVKGTMTNPSSNDYLSTRGETVAKVLKEYVKFVDGVIIDNGIKLSDSELLQKAVRDRLVQPIIEDSGVLKLMIDDFTKLSSDLVTALAQLNEKLPKEVLVLDKEEKSKGDKSNSTEQKEKEDKADKKTDEIKSTDIQSLLNNLAEAKRKVLDFINGENAEDYLKVSLAYLQKPIRDAVLGMDKYAWTQAVYNKNYSDLPQTDATISKESVDKEYEEWKDKADDVLKFKTVGVKAYDQLLKDFSQSLYDYADSLYGDVRDVVMKDLLSSENFSLQRNIIDTTWRNQLLRLSKKLSLAGLSGVNLEDKLKISVNIRNHIVEKLINKNDKFFKDMVRIIEDARIKSWEETPEELKNIIKEDLSLRLSEEDYKKEFEETLIRELEKIPVENLTEEIVNQIIINTANKPYAAAFTLEIKKVIPNDATTQLAKEIVDTKLLEYGFSPEKNIIFDDNKNLDFLIEGYISAITSPKLKTGEFVNLTDDILDAYLDSTEVIDNEIVINIKNRCLNDVVKTIPLFIREILIASQGTLKVPQTSKEDLESSLYTGINNNEDITNIVKNWVDSIFNSDPNFVNDEEVKDEALDNILSILKDIDSIKLYNKAINKISKRNPLYDTLRELGMKVFDGDDMKIFDLLKNESTFMSKLPDLSEYMRQGVTKEAIDNFLVKLDLLKALTIGTEKTSIDPEHQFGFNVQMARWNEKYRDGKDANKYKTIDTKTVHQIIQDILLLENKLLFAKILIETNTESKLKSNQKLKTNFENYAVNWFKENATKLTIDGISILPPADEIDKKETEEEKLHFIEHTIRTNIVSMLNNGKQIPQIIEQLFDNVQINRDEILSHGLYSEPLNSESWSGLSSYDLFVYLTTIIGSDSYEFDSKLIDVFGQESYKFIPFFIQEYAAKAMYSFASDNKGVHTAAVNWLYKDIYLSNNQKASNIFFLNGIAGAGKTSAIMSLVALMLKGKKVFAAAPNETQANNFKLSLTELSELEGLQIFDKLKLLSYFFTDEALLKFIQTTENVDLSDILKSEKIEDGEVWVSTISESFIKELSLENIPDIIFIDEITHFSLPELIALDKVALKYNVKIITSGDTLQKGVEINGVPANIQEIFTFKTPALTVSVRSNNIHNKDNVDTMLSALRLAETWFLKNHYNPNSKEVQQFLSGLQPKYFQDLNDILGAKITTEDISVDDIKTLVSAAKQNNKTIAVIANLDGDDKIIDQVLITKLKDAGLKDGEFELYTPESLHKKAVQGSEADYVIVWDMPNAPADKYLSLINLYTYTSRALVGTLLRDKGNQYKRSLGFVNLKMSYTGPYETPGLDQQKRIKDLRIDLLKKVIGNYVIPVEEKKKQELKHTTPQITKNVEDDLDPTTKKEILNTLEEGEQNALELKKDKKEQPKYEDANPETWTPNTLYGYGFYNHVNAYRDSNGLYFSISTGSSLDLDGLFEDKKIFIPAAVITGFIKFKNLLALYPDVSSEEFRLGFEDELILRFFDRINPDVSDSENEYDRFNDIKAYYLGDDSTPGKLRVESGLYVYAKKYNARIDDSARTVDGGNNPLTEKDTWLGYGRRVYTEDGSLNQYITIGVLPKVSTLDKWKIDIPEYKEFVNQAIKDTNESAEIKIYKLDSELEAKTNLILRSAEKDRFVSVKDMINHYGIVFESYDDGTPVIGLINNKKSEVNGILSFEILHYIASVEKSPLSYEDRIKLLEKAFVKENGDLKIAGKYFTTAGLSGVSDPNFRRVLILEPEGYTFREALEYLRDLSLRLALHEDFGKTSILEEKATAMSLASLKRLLFSMFQTLGCVDSNGNSIGDGILPYVEFTLNNIEEKYTGNSKMSRIVRETRDLIDVYKQKGGYFDMDFLSQLMRMSTDLENNEELEHKDTHLFGILLIDNHISFADSVVKARLLPEEGRTKRAVKDMDFDIDATSYREFGVGYQYIEKTANDEFTYRTIQVRVNNNSLFHLGLSNHFLEMPKYSINPESFKTIKKLSSTEAKLIHKKVDFTNLEKIDLKTSKKLTPTTDSIAKLRKNFNVEYDVVYDKKDKKVGKNNFYHEVFLSRDNWKDRLRFVVKPKDANGFEVREGDTIQVCGDTTHNYRVKYIDTKKKRLEFDLMDGNEIIENGHKSCMFSDISNVVSREIPKWSSDSIKKIINDDYYQEAKYNELVSEQKASKRESAKVVSVNNLTVDEIKKLATKAGFLLIYPVKNSDASVLTPIETAIQTVDELNSLEDLGWIAIDSGKDTNWTQEELNNHIEETSIKVQEAISKLSDTEDLNGIAIVGFFGDKAALWAAKREDVLNDITEGYVQKYIAYTTNPKLTNPNISNSEELSKKKQIIEAPKKKEQKTKIESLLLTATTYEEFKNKVFDEVVGNTKEDVIKTYPASKYYVYKADDEKWHVFPKLSTVNDIYADAKKDVKEFLSSVPKLGISKDLKILYRTLDGQKYESTVESITEDGIKLNYSIHDNQYSIIKEANEFEWLAGVLFFITTPDSNMKNISSEGDLKQDVDDFQELLSDRFGNENAELIKTIIYSNSLELGLLLNEEQNIINDKLSELAKWLLEDETTEMLDLELIFGNKTNIDKLSLAIEKMLITPYDSLDELFVWDLDGFDLKKC